MYVCVVLCALECVCCAVCVSVCVVLCALVCVCARACVCMCTYASPWLLVNIIFISGLGNGKSRSSDGVCNCVGHQNGSSNVSLPLLPPICALFTIFKLTE